MIKEVRFWLAIVAAMLFGLGTLPTLHGMLCWSAGVLCLVILYYIKGGLNE